MAVNTYSLDLELSSTQGAVKTSATAALKITGDLSIQLWVNFESLPANTVRMQFASMVDDATGVTPYDFYLYNNGGTYELRLRNDNGTTNEEVAVAWTPSTGTWYHVAATVATATVKFYVGGAQQGTNQTFANTRAASGTPGFAVGIYDADSPTIRMFDGLVDELAIHNVALTSFSTQADHTGEANLQGYWQFNNDLTDVTGANNLTGVNAPAFSTSVPFVTYGGVTINTGYSFFM